MLGGTLLAMLVARIAAVYPPGSDNERSSPSHRLLLPHLDEIATNSWATEVCCRDLQGLPADRRSEFEIFIGRLQFLRALQGNWQRKPDAEMFAPRLPGRLNQKKRRF
jgi:hypothetical protein